MAEEIADIDAAVADFERKLDRLRILYEQYFLGIQKREPLVQLKEVVRLLYLLDQQHIRNTSLRYRFRNQAQKFNSYRSYWKRTLREIDQGTYRRDVNRAKRNLAARGLSADALGSARSPGAFERALASMAEAPSPPPEAGATETASATKGGAGVAAEQQPRPAVDAAPAPSAGSRPPAPPPLPADVGAKPAPARAAAAQGLPEAQLQSLYRRMVKAKTMCGEDAGGLRYETLVKSIERQLPRLRELHPNKEIEFHVVIQNGRAALKAKAR